MASASLRDEVSACALFASVSVCVCFCQEVLEEAKTLWDKLMAAKSASVGPQAPSRKGAGTKATGKGQGGKRAAETPAGPFAFVYAFPPLWLFMVTVARRRGEEQASRWQGLQQGR